LLEVNKKALYKSLRPYAQKIFYQTNQWCTNECNDDIASLR